MSALENGQSIEDATEAKAAYAARVSANYPHNRRFGLMSGLFAYAGLGLVNFESIMSVFVFDLSGSNLLVGLLSTASAWGFMLAQIYGMSKLEALPRKLGTMVRYCFANRFTRLLMGLSLLIFSHSVTLILFVLFFFAGEFFAGLYLLLFFDFMAGAIPREERGRFFGLRNSLSLIAQAGAGYTAGRLVGLYSYLGGNTYRSPLGYALCFLLSFAVHLVDVSLLRRMKEEASLSAGKAIPVFAKLRTLPAFFQQDRNFAWYCSLRGLCLLPFVAVPFFMVYAKNRITLTGEILGTLTMVRIFAWALGTYLTGRLANRFGFKQLLEGCSAGFAATLFLTPLLSNTPAFFLFTAINGLLTGGVMLSIDSLQMEFGPSASRPTYIAVATVASSLVFSLFPPAAGFIATRLSYNAMFAGVGIAMLTSALLLRLRVTDPRRVAAYQD